MAVVIAILAISVTLPRTAQAAKAACWQRVITDWTDGRLTGSYAPKCYRAAIRHLPEDLRTYSSAQDDINRALLEVTSHEERSIAAAGPTASPLEASTVARADSPSIAALLMVALGSLVVLTGGASAFLVARRRRSTAK